jgi:hypothetical protein
MSAKTFCDSENSSESPTSEVVANRARAPRAFSIRSRAAEDSSAKKAQLQNSYDALQRLNLIDEPSGGTLREVQHYRRIASHQKASKCAVLKLLRAHRGRAHGLIRFVLHRLHRL